MRIGLVCPYDLSRPGGVQAQVKGLASELRSHGDEALVIGPGLGDELEGVDLGRTLAVPGNRSRVPLSVDPRVGRRIASVAGDLDLLHVHEPLMPTVSLSALRTGIPVIATFHAAPGPVGAGFYSVVGSGLSRLLGPNVRRVTAVSKAAAAPLPSGMEVTIVPNGIDVDSFLSGEQRNPHQVVFLGRDEKRKGLEVLLAAWEQVSGVNSEYRLIVMGADRGVDGIEWLGPVDEADKRRWLGSSAIYVAPNLGGESFGIVLVEAMAAGAAVVASDLDAFREVGGEAIAYFETGDSGALARCLSELLTDPTAVAEMSTAGRRRARLFDWADVTLRYRHVYEEALS